MPYSCQTEFNRHKMATLFLPFFSPTPAVNQSASAASNEWQGRKTRQPSKSQWMAAILLSSKESRRRTKEDFFAPNQWRRSVQKQRREDGGTRNRTQQNLADVILVFRRRRRVLVIKPMPIYAAWIFLSLLSKNYHFTSAREKNTRIVRMFFISFLEALSS